MGQPDTRPSYISAIPRQSLVKVRTYKQRGVGYVMESSQFVTQPPPGFQRYDIKFAGFNPVAVKVSEWDDYHNNPIRRLRFWEFLWYRDPVTGGQKIGNNRAWPLIYGQVIAILCAWAFFRYGASDGLGVALGWVCASFSVLLPIGALITTYANFKGKTA